MEKGQLNKEEQKADVNPHEQNCEQKSTMWLLFFFWYSVKTVWGLSLVCGTIHIHNTYIQMFIEEEVSAVYIIPLVHGIISNQFSSNSWHNFKPIHKYNMQLFDYNYGINQTEITAGHMNMISRLLIKCSVIH